MARIFKDINISNSSTLDHNSNYTPSYSGPTVHHQPQISKMTSINKTSSGHQPVTAIEQLQDMKLEGSHGSSSRQDDTPNASGLTSSGSASNTSLTTLRNDGDSIFVKTRDADDVFGESPVVPALPRSDAERVASRIAADLQVGNSLHSVDKQAPRADRIHSPITPANAQGVLPPEACIFAANLSIMRTDEQLEYSCHQAFDVFGQCVIKVRRDRNRHPFALVQFYSPQDAINAIEGARSLVVDGRHIRVEPAQARRSVILAKIDGSSPTTEEARNVLQEYGPIEKVYPTSNGDVARLGVPAGIWVQFAYYLDYKDATKFFNSSNQIYRVHVPPEISPRGRYDNTESPSIHGLRTPRSSTDQKSIFVGNLPVDVDEHELRSIFGHFGEIRAVNVIHKPIQGGPGLNVFAFIEYEGGMQAIRAAEQEFDLRGQRIRVEPKEYSARRQSRLQQYSPSHFYPGPPRHSMSHIYSSPVGPMQYTPSSQQYFEMSPMTQGFHQLPQDMTAYQSYGRNHIYATPPASNRVGRSNNPLLNSPGVVGYYTPLQFQSNFPRMSPLQEDYSQSRHPPMM